MIENLLQQRPLVVGKAGTRSLTIEQTDAALLAQRLPSGGPPAPLPANGDQMLATASVPLNRKGRFANVFLGQTISLSLKVNDAVDSINRSFDECRMSVNCATSTVVPDSFNDTFASRQTLSSSNQPPNIEVRTSNLDA